MQRTLLALCTLALAAAPVLAGPVYLPGAINEVDGAYVRSTEIWVTNPDVGVQGFVARRIPAGTNGTVRTPGDELGPYYLAPAESKRYSDFVPSGFRGIIELDGAPMLQFSGVLTVRTVNGSKVAEAEVPVLNQLDISAPGSWVALQGWERAGSTVTTNLGIVNLAHSPAVCSVHIRKRDGLLVVQNVPISVQPLSSVQFDDALALVGQVSVAEGARGEVSCNQSFSAYHSTYNDQSGEVEFMGPAKSVGASTLVEPTAVDPGPDPDPDPDPPPGNAVVFTRDGLIVRYPTNHGGLNNYRVNLPFSGEREFRKVDLDFDFHIGGWDPRNGNGFHCIFWLNNGSSWNNMFGYVNTRGNRNLTVFQVNATGAGRMEQASGGSPQPGGNYHMHYEYDLDEDTVFYRITTAGGNTVVSRAYNLRGNTFSTSRFFIEFGYQHAPEGPEAYTPGWTFSNLNIAFIP